MFKKKLPNLAEPCFSYAVGTRRFNSDNDALILSLRFFSITPLLFFRLIN